MTMGKLAAVLDSLDDLPEEFHDEYEEGDDGKYHLKLVKGMVPEKDADQFEELKGALSKERNDSRTLKQRLRELETQLETMGGLDGIKELAEAQREAERKNLEKKGEYDKLLGQVKEQHAQEVAQLKEANAKLRTRLDAEIRGRQVAEAISKLDGNPTLLKPILMQKTKLVGDVDAGEDLRVEVIDGDSPLVDGEGNMLSVEGYVKRLRADEAFAGAFRGTGNSGGGGGGDGAANGANQGGRPQGGGMPPELASLKRSQMTPRQRVDVQNFLAEKHNGDREAALTEYLQIPE